MADLKKVLEECGALQFGDFTLASGAKSNYYIDIKKVSTKPAVLSLIAKEMACRMKEMGLSPDRVAGVVLGSISLATALSLETGIPLLMVRKEKKDHGTGKIVEGDLCKGDDVLVIEDVVTTAGSSMKAIAALREEGANVEKVFSVIDREGGGRENLASIGVQLNALVKGLGLQGRETVSFRSPAKDCSLCGLCAGRMNLVLPSGDLGSPVVLVGEAPGENEDLQGRPFVGRAGEILNQVFADTGVDRASVMITNTVKCRPPGNRDPLPEEMAACRPFLDSELEGRKVVVGLGKSAIRDLMGYTGPMKAVVNTRQYITVNGKSVLFIPTYHPMACVYQEAAYKEIRRTMAMVKKEFL